jgi:hypothetical protein
MLLQPKTAAAEMPAATAKVAAAQHAQAAAAAEKAKQAEEEAALCLVRVVRPLADAADSDVQRTSSLNAAVGWNSLAAWLAAAKCDVYAQQLEEIEGITMLDDLVALLDDSDEDLYSRLKAFMKPADARRFVLSLRTDFSLWLLKVGCGEYKRQLLAMGYKSTDDMFELQDESDDSIRAKFAFIGQAKKANLQRLIKGIRAIVI